MIYIFGHKLITLRIRIFFIYLLEAPINCLRVTSPNFLSRTEPDPELSDFDADELPGTLEDPLLFLKIP